MGGIIMEDIKTFTETPPEKQKNFGKTAYRGTQRTFKEFKNAILLSAPLWALILLIIFIFVS